MIQSILPSKHIGAKVQAQKPPPSSSENTGGGGGTEKAAPFVWQWMAQSCFSPVPLGNSQDGILCGRN